MPPPKKGEEGEYFPPVEGLNDPQKVREKHGIAK